MERAIDHQPAPSLPAALWERLRADPSRAPEHLALAAAEVHGPAAAAWLEEMRGRYAYGPAELARMAKRRHATLARLGGAATGVGGALMAVPDLAGLAWVQSRMVFFVAAAFGFDPRDPMRPAELLVLQDVYPDPVAARAALDGTGTRVAEAYVSSRLGRDQEHALARRLLTLVGRKAAKRFILRAVPVVAIPFNAIGNERETRRLADRAIAFYGG